MLGYPNQPVIVPGQFPHFPGVNGNQIRNYYNAPFYPGQIPQGVVVQYYYQVQPQRQQPQTPQTQPQLSAQVPVPRFTGYQGPGGWQPWGMDNRWFLSETSDLPVASSNDTPPSSPGSTSSSTTTDSDHSDLEPHSQTSSDQTAPACQCHGSDEGPSDSEDEPQTSLPRSTTAPCGASIEPGRSSRPSPEASLSTPPEEPLPSSTSPSNATLLSGKPRYYVPSLIPLYDYRPAPAQQPLHQHINAWQRGHPPPGHPTQTYPPGTGIQTQLPQTQPRPAVPHFPNTGARQRTPIHQMPPTLTDEQLAMMDTLTREAIDERLRVLEGVSGAVFRCIDELLRMRSVLPPSSGPTPAVPLTPSLEREVPVTPGVSQMTPIDAVQGASQAPDRSQAKDPEIPNGEHRKG